ncbi:MAG TPA: molybdopterin cofactor-binding domain-containing protein [Candidatus Dormibacteraeota bacterium]
MGVTQLVGAKIQRREDPRLITGHGRYVDDHVRAATAHAAIVRSPLPHARIQLIDVSAAKAAPGVIAVYTYVDFKPFLVGPMPVSPAFVPEKKSVPEHWPIANYEVAYQGEPVAVVLAESRAQAADAAQLVDIDYEPLPAVMDVFAGLEGGPLAQTSLPDNVGWDLTYNADAEASFAEADVVVKERIHQQRLSPNPMEPRAIIADWEPGAEGALTVYASSQNPHLLRLWLTLSLGVPESKIRVISPDVGGGFGSKISSYPEDYLIPLAARLSGRPVKWNETRTENLQTAYAGRGQVYDVEVAAKRDGTLLGMKITQYVDLGAYIGNLGAFMAVACLLGGGAYGWRQIAARTIGVLTNRVPTDPYRGAGRPEATHLVERIVDRVAGELGMDAAEIRRMNFIREFPYTSPFGLVYDSGDYEGSLDKAMQLAGYEDLRRRQAELRQQGRYLGIGLSTWIEICGLGPSAATAPATGGIALTDSAQVRVFPTGSVGVYVGTHSHGQGHDTTFSQLVAEALGVPMQTIEIHHGDTAEGAAIGLGTYGSRSLAVGGVALTIACQRVIEKGKKLAAHLLEAAEEDIVFEHGAYQVKGSPDRAKALGEIAFASYGAGLPEGYEHGLEAVAYFDPPNFTWPFGAHLCVVEVDPETVGVKLEKYIGVDDVGNQINPMIVEGQIQGGVAQGIAQALFEEMVYDPESGQLKTGTFLDYMMPTVNEIPETIFDSTVTPSPTNPLGAKGVGEAGTIAASAAVINAICDALAPLGIKHVDMPASPDRLWKQIQEARHRSGNGHREGVVA